jgi:hypothetical protein
MDTATHGRLFCPIHWVSHWCLEHRHRRKQRLRWWCSKHSDNHSKPNRERAQRVGHDALTADRLCLLQNASFSGCCCRHTALWSTGRDGGAGRHGNTFSCRGTGCVYEREGKGEGGMKRRNLPHGRSSGQHCTTLCHDC